MCEMISHKMPQYGNKKPMPHYMPDAPINYLPADGLKGPGDAKGGTGVRSHKTRQSTGNKKMKVD
jgi:hypothetical protein